MEMENKVKKPFSIHKFLSLNIYRWTKEKHEYLYIWQVGINVDIVVVNCMRVHIILDLCPRTVICYMYLKNSYLLTLNEYN